MGKAPRRSTGHRESSCPHECAGAIDRVVRILITAERIGMFPQIPAHVSRKPACLLRDARRRGRNGRLFSLVAVFALGGCATLPDGGMSVPAALARSELRK